MKKPMLVLLVLLMMTALALAVMARQEPVALPQLPAVSTPTDVLPGTPAALPTPEAVG